MNNNLERIAQFLRDEEYPKTPQEISNWTNIRLDCVYYTLQNNKTFFRQIIDKNDFLIGWTTEF